MDAKKMGEFIANERKALNLTQEDLANKLFVSSKTVSKWETGKGVPNSNYFLPLANLFQVSVNELLLGKRVDDKVKLANETTMKMVRKERVLYSALSFLCLLCLMILDVLLWVAGVDGILWYLIIGVVVILAFLIEFGAKKGL